ncbi:type II toxin-antitoxin system RelE/ParE family toxin [Cohnella silvisoli]|uniref:Type II toxin-antitoxin system RelE/ParE family toxin n=1 Tax=Cohnella silvisoli TaxID=2873699 RepID=A0ABV1KNQ8_9BACL|nr:type II toxin-antitoxin system RelE/ParE family toxin [Cohnella silvisoli]MCD9020200.1 type II toxin-antitoxin system RelE/ParE family toxin [Cohnella silvisoli]
MYKFEFASLPEVNAFLEDIEDRKNKGDKHARIMFEKIAYCIERVRLQGTRAGIKIIKDLKGKENDNLYELRPLDERIFMCLWNGNHFIMLSHYTKDANETDDLELAKARRLRDKYMREHPFEGKDKKSGRR